MEKCEVRKEFFRLEIATRFINNSLCKLYGSKGVLQARNCNTFYQQQPLRALWKNAKFEKKFFRLEIAIRFIKKLPMEKC